MMEKMFHGEGPVMGFLDKTGHLVMLSVLWIVGCLPVITAGTSTAALYYAVIKSIRRERGSAVTEFFRSYRANLGRGSGLSLAMLALLGGDLAILLRFRSPVITAAALTGLLLLGLTGVFAPAVLSRFSIPLGRVWKLSFVMSLRFAGWGILILMGTGLLLLLQFFVLPMATALIMPGLWCLAVTFPIEKVLRHYMPKKEETDQDWYYED